MFQQHFGYFNFEDLDVVYVVLYNTTWKCE